MEEEKQEPDLLRRRGDQKKKDFLLGRRCG